MYYRKWLTAVRLRSSVICQGPGKAGGRFVLSQRPRTREPTELRAGKMTPRSNRGRVLSSASSSIHPQVGALPHSAS